MLAFIEALRCDQRIALLRRELCYGDGFKFHFRNYGDRYRNGECIATGFVESTINQVVSKRFVKHQLMRWTERGTHLLLQVRLEP